MKAGTAVAEHILQDRFVEHRQGQRQNTDMRQTPRENFSGGDVNILERADEEKQIDGNADHADKEGYTAQGLEHAVVGTTLGADGQSHLHEEAPKERQPHQEATQLVMLKGCTLRRWPVVRLLRTRRKRRSSLVF